MDFYSTNYRTLTYLGRSFSAIWRASFTWLDCFLIPNSWFYAFFSRAFFSVFRSPSIFLSACVVFECRKQKISFSIITRWAHEYLMNFMENVIKCESEVCTDWSAASKNLINKLDAARGREKVNVHFIVSKTQQQQSINVNNFGITMFYVMIISSKQRKELKCLELSYDIEPGTRRECMSSVCAGFEGSNWDLAQDCSPCKRTKM